MNDYLDILRVAVFSKTLAASQNSSVQWMSTPAVWDYLLASSKIIQNIDSKVNSNRKLHTVDQRSVHPIWGILTWGTYSKYIFSNKSSTKYLTSLTPTRCWNEYQRMGRCSRMGWTATTRQAHHDKGYPRLSCRKLPMNDAMNEISRRVVRTLASRNWDCRELTWHVSMEHFLNLMERQTSLTSRAWGRQAVTNPSTNTTAHVLLRGTREQANALYIWTQREDLQYHLLFYTASCFS